MFTLIALAGALSALRVADAKVAVVAWRLQTANVAMCKNAVLLPGFSIETLDQYSESERANAVAELGFGDLPQASSVVPESAAGKAGLKSGDAIIAIDGMRLPRTVSRKAGYTRTAAMVRALSAALAKPPVIVTLISRTISINGDRGCASSVELVPGKQLNALADGQHVQISGAMYQFTASDDELAFVIAHELAHNLFPEAAHVTDGVGQRMAELAADRAAIRMMVCAGYDERAVVPLMERLRRKNHLSWLAGSHPAWRRRLAAAARAVGDTPSICR